MVEANNTQDTEAREDAMECSTKKKQKKKLSMQTYRELILPPGTVASQWKTSRFKRRQQHDLHKEKNAEEEVAAILRYSKYSVDDSNISHSCRPVFWKPLGHFLRPAESKFQR